MHESQFAEASILLVENGAATASVAGLDAQSISVREAFTAAIEVDTAAQVRQQLDAGNVHRALDLCEARIRLCPWSSALADCRDDCVAKVGQIRETERLWISLLSEPAPAREGLRRALAEADGQPAWWLDSPILPGLREVMRCVLVEAGVAELQELGFRMPAQAAALLLKDLQLAQVDPGKLKLLVDLQELLRNLPEPSRVCEEGLDTNDGSLLGVVRQIVTTQGIPLFAGSAPIEGKAAGLLVGGSGDPRVARLRQQLASSNVRTLTQSLEASASGCRAELCTQIGAILTAALAFPGMENSYIGEAELWVDTNLLGNAILVPLAKAHVRAAELAASDPIACKMALLHLARARTLGHSVSDPDYRQAMRLAKETHRLNPRIKVHFSVDDAFFKAAPDLALLCEKGADKDGLEPYKMLNHCLLTGFSPIAPALTSIVWRASWREDFVTAPAPPVPAVMLRIEKLVEEVKKVNVRRVQMQVCLGEDEVENPDKRALRAELDLRGEELRRFEEWLEHEYALIEAEQSRLGFETPEILARLEEWDEAASKHNRNIKIANAEVDRHNAMPDTVMVPYYVADEKEYGAVRGFVRVDVVAAVDVAGVSGGVEKQLSKGRNSRDYPYFDLTFLTDDDPAHANDMYYPDAVIAERGSRMPIWEAVFAAVAKDLNLDLGRLKIRTELVLCDYQVIILQWLLHPLGVQRSIAQELGVPAWAIQVLDSAELF